MRLGAKLLLGFAGVAALAAFFVARVFTDEVKPGVRQAMEASLVDTANTLAALAAPDLAAGRIDRGDFARAIGAAAQRPLDVRFWGFAKRRVELRVMVTDARGTVVFDSQGRDVGRDYARWNDVYLTLRGQYGARSSPEGEGRDAPTVMHVAAPVYAPDTPGRLIGVLSVAQPNAAFEPFIHAGQRAILRQGLWLVLASALVGAGMTWWLSRRIGALTRYARAVAEGAPVAPPPAGSDEIGQLGQALETMRRKLEGKAYVEQYVQALTHEMKSPLAGIRAAAELLQEPLPEPERQRFAASVLAQQQRLTTTIDKLLALAEVEQHGWLRTREAVALAPLLEQAAAMARQRAPGRGVAVVVGACPQAATVQGDPYLLRQALANLLDNAVAFSPEGAQVQVECTLAHGRVRIGVRDAGPGVPDYAAGRVFERFFSLPAPASGQRSSGLGLPFVREVARLHGGQASLDNAPGGGALAVLDLPQA